MPRGVLLVERLLSADDSPLYGAGEPSRACAPRSTSMLVALDGETFGG